MRRNYGSLNLAALDLSTNARATVDSSGSNSSQQYAQESSLLAHELAHLDFHDECASAVGYPIEFFADDAHADAPRCRKRNLSAFNLSAETRASSSASITSTCSTASSTSSNVSTGISIPVSAPTEPTKQANSYYPIQKQHNLAIDLPQRLVEQHHMELNALRCFSLNLMLSSSSPCGNGSGGGIVTVPQPSTSVPKMNAFEFEISCQPLQGDRVSAALLAGRRGSLPRNMIQSV